LTIYDLWSWMERWDEVQQYFPDEKYQELVKAMEKYM
jgi:hypothetical protein